MSEEYGPDILTLEDEDGVEHEFEVVDAVEHSGINYLAVIPFDGEDAQDAEDSAELLIMRVTVDNDEEFLDIVEDDNEFAELAEVFGNRLSAMYDIEESEEE